MHETIKGPKLRRLARSLNCSKAEAIGVLVYIWLWAMDNADKSGRLMDATVEDIEEALVGATSLPTNVVVKALFDTDWIDIVGDSIYIHDWETWQEQWYKAKERREKDKARKQGTAKSYDFLPEQISIEDCSKPERPEPEAKAEKKEPVKQTYTQNFQDIWEAYYGDKGAKAEAYKAYKARLNDGWTPEQLLIAVKNYAAQEKKRGTEPMYVKRVKTFFGPSTPFTDFLPNKGSLKEEEKLYTGNPFAEYEEDI